ncbi:MAG: glycosyl transferase family 2 [Gemmataceae bacterium]
MQHVEHRLSLGGRDALDPGHRLGLAAVLAWARRRRLWARSRTERWLWATLTWIYRAGRWLVTGCRSLPAGVVTWDLPEPRLAGLGGALTGWVWCRRPPVHIVRCTLAGQDVRAFIQTYPRPDVKRLAGRRLRSVVGLRLMPPRTVATPGPHQLVLCLADADGRVWRTQTTVTVAADYRPDSSSLPAHLVGSDRLYQWWRAATASRCPIAPPHRDDPLLSVIMPVYRPALAHLRAALESLYAQTYTRWQLCLCLDGPQSAEVRELITRWAADPRIQIVSLPWRQGIVAASRAALAQASGDYVAFFDQDDLLEPRALALVAASVRARTLDVVYTDEDRLDATGYCVQPIFKPDWSPDLLLARMYWGHLCVYRHDFLRRLGGVRDGFDGSQDYDLALRAGACTERIGHIAEVLYHWRTGGFSHRPSGQKRCHECGRRALRDRLRSHTPPVAIEDGPHAGAYHVRYRWPTWPRVSIVIPTRGQGGFLRRCLHTIRRRTRYPAYEIILVDNGCQDDTVRRCAARYRTQLLDRIGPFNHSALCNAGAQRAQSELLVFLNDDTEVVSPDWLFALAEQALRPEVGAVGALLYYPDGRIQHAGIALGRGLGAMPIQAALLADGLDRGTAFLIRNVSAVTGACMMLRRDVFRAAGGFDEHTFPTSFNDVDLCARISALGLRIVYTPLAQLIHWESATRAVRQQDELAFAERLRRRWHERVADDPFWRVPDFMSCALMRQAA